MKKSFILISILFILSSCVIAREMNELSVVTAVGVDKLMDKYEVTVQIINSSEIKSEVSGSRTTITSYKEEGKTIFEALRRIATKLPYEAYYGHIQLLAISEELAEEGIKKIVDFFIRDHEFRTDIFVVIVKENSANNFISIMSPLEKITSNKINKSIQISKDLTGSNATTELFELAIIMMSEGREPVIPGVKIIGLPEEGNDIENVGKVKPQTIVEVSNIAVFREDYLVGWLNYNESIDYNIVMNNIKSTIINLPCDDEYVSIEVTKLKSKINPESIKNGYEIIIDIDIEANIGEMMCSIDINNQKDIEKLENDVSLIIKNRTKQIFYNSQKYYKSDIFGIGELIRKKDYKYWNMVKDNWYEYYSSINVKVHVKTNLRGTGKVKKLF